MPPSLILSDEEYVSSEDEDFAPDAVPIQDDSSDSEVQEDETTRTSNKKRPTKRNGDSDDDAEDAGFENSGDEAIIDKGMKRRKKKSKKGGKHDELEDDEDGEGGLVKTRSMRAQEYVNGRAYLNPEPSRTTSQSPELHRNSRERSSFNGAPESMVMIQRTYNFAGKVYTEQKLVHRDSAEAKLYFASQKDIAQKEPEMLVKPKRPVKKARRSIFEPVNEHALPVRGDLQFGAKAGLGANVKDAKKLNTVEKSAMDWAGFVDKEGIKDELDAAGKKKGAFKERIDFLARVERKKDEKERRARGLPI
ncbi:SWR1-complex 5 protein [Rutstroemia sp. NJR-2017a BBW]|nr:SWR1-complex 5 protein [Rutstroemia sp. NJR-2017a BBW]